MDNRSTFEEKVMLAQELKEGTKKSHSLAENTSFVKGFLRGTLSEYNYVVLLSNFYYIYRALEEEVGVHNKNPKVGSINFEELKRVPSIVEDLKYFIGYDWVNRVTLTDATQKYVNRIREVSKESPYLLLGHHYTRYLGDLSGGQILKGIAKKALKLEDEGLAFYDFKKIDDTKAFKEKYRSVLNSIDLTESERNAIVVEANYAFRLNMYMFEEFEGNIFKTLWNLVRG